jgi:prepilin-type N-terminal cleavage/methylation domain-containing protein
MKRFSTDSTMKNPTPHQVINSSKTSHRFQAAFTLVELLVVIAILAILAALLFPLLGSMRIKASSAVSVSNLRNIGIAIVTYAADNNGTLPGPTYAHLGPKYQLLGSTNVLPWILRDYLPYVNQPQNPIQNTRYSPTFDYPAARSDGKNPVSTNKVTYSYGGATDANGTFLPLGYPNPPTPPMKIAGLAARDTREKPLINESGQIEPAPHGKYRNTLMLDFSVKAIPTTN